MAQDPDSVEVAPDELVECQHQETLSQESPKADQTQEPVEAVR